MSVAYIGPKSRTERPRKTIIGIEVAHVTRDSDTTFKVKVTWGGGILWRPRSQLVNIVIITISRKLKQVGLSPGKSLCFAHYSGTD